MKTIALASLMLITASPGIAAPPAAPANPAPSAPAKAWPVTPGDYTIQDFQFHDGSTLPALKLHYRTLGTPKRDKSGNITNAVMVLHGTGGTGEQFLRPQFADELYGPGQPLDITRYYIILPDGIGHGGSSKPSDGLRMAFPKYNYADMVKAQHALLTKGLGVTSLRLLMGTSMGCMHDFIWGETYPGFAHAIMPTACLPVEIAGRNRIWRKMLIDAIEQDPGWNGGNYTAPPQAGMRTVAALLFVAGSSPVRQQADWPTRATAEAALAAYGKATPPDANDSIYQFDASRDYNPEPLLERITVPVTWINSADDMINPPGLGIAEQQVRRMPNARFILIPESADTHGHGTHTWAKFWKADLVSLLARSEQEPAK
jgi:homoserine O-acetyltransferase